MGLVIDLGQVLEIQVGIDLCGGNIRMTQQFLHGAQVTTGFQQVTGKRMAQAMGVYMTIDSLAYTPLPETFLYIALGNTLTALTDK